jgi:hypothetical protein
MGKSTISMALFNSKLLNYQRVSMLNLLFFIVFLASLTIPSARGASKLPRQCCGRAAARRVAYDAQVLHSKLGAQPKD